MPKFTAYVSREVSLEFEIEAESREKAAELALDMHCKFCTDIEELDSGQTFGARVYAQGEDTFGQGVSFETEAGRLRDTGPEMLEALQAASDWIDTQLGEPRLEIQGKVQAAIAKAAGTMEAA